jgi:hypothetical protein
LRFDAALCFAGETSRDFDIPAKPPPRENLTVRLPGELIERLRRLAKS